MINYIKSKFQNDVYITFILIISASKVISFIVNSISIYILNPDVLGLYSGFVQFSTFVIMISKGGIDQAFQSELNKSNLNEKIVINTFFNRYLTALALFFILILILKYFNINFVSYAQIFSLSTFLIYGLLIIMGHFLSSFFIFNLDYIRIIFVSLILSFTIFLFYLFYYFLESVEKSIICSSILGVLFFYYIIFHQFITKFKFRVSCQSLLVNHSNISAGFFLVQLFPVYVTTINMLLLANISLNSVALYRVLLIPVGIVAIIGSSLNTLNIGVKNLNTNKSNNIFKLTIVIALTLIFIIDLLGVIPASYSLDFRVYFPIILFSYYFSSESYNIFARFDDYQKSLSIKLILSLFFIVSVFAFAFSGFSLKLVILFDFFASFSVWFLFRVLLCWPASFFYNSSLLGYFYYFFIFIYMLLFFF